MGFDAFLDGLNKGGFAFLGMCVVAVVAFGGTAFLRWLVKFISTAWPEFMQAIRQVGVDSKETATIYQTTTREALAQTNKVVEKQSMMVDTIMDSHKTLIEKVNNIAEKVGGNR